MANVVNGLARFYPIEGSIDKEQFLSYFDQFKTQFWRSWYHINEIENCVEFIYPCKRPISKDIFTDQGVLNSYHIWIRVADSSCYEDFIGFKSQYYKTELNKVGYNCKLWAGFTDDWNYANSCLYKADELCVKFNSRKTNFLEKLIKFEDYHKVNKELNSDLSWSHKMMISYMKSSQNWFWEVSKYEHIELDYFNSDYNWSDSHIFKIFTSDKRVAIKEELIDKLFKLDSNYEQNKFDESLEEISLRLDGRTIHKFSWNEKDSKWHDRGWIEKTISDWSNITDSEFVEFKARYNK